MRQSIEQELVERSLDTMTMIFRALAIGEGRKTTESSIRASALLVQKDLLELRQRLAA